MVENANLNDTGDDNTNDKEATLLEKEVAEKEIIEPLDEEAILRQQLEEEQIKSAEYLDGWQRARAELANARKRWEREAAQTYSSAVADVIAKLLPTVDDFERAIETVPHSLDDRTWVDGILLIHRKLQNALEQQGIIPIEAEPGMPFDPTYHQAITHESHQTFEAGTIIAEFQKGYKLGDRIVRPALVRVSSGPPPADQDSQIESVS